MKNLGCCELAVLWICEEKRKLAKNKLKDFRMGTQIVLQHKLQTDLPGRKTRFICEQHLRINMKQERLLQRMTPTQSCLTSRQGKHGGIRTVPECRTLLFTKKGSTFTSTSFLFRKVFPRTFVFTDELLL